MSEFILQTCFQLLSPTSKNTNNTPGQLQQPVSFCSFLEFSNAIFFTMCTERLDGTSTIVAPLVSIMVLSVNPRLQPPTVSFIFLFKWIYTYFPGRSLSAAVTLIRHRWKLLFSLHSIYLEPAEWQAKLQSTSGIWKKNEKITTKTTATLRAPSFYGARKSQLLLDCIQMESLVTSADDEDKMTAARLLMFRNVVLAVASSWITPC